MPEQRPADAAPGGPPLADALRVAAAAWLRLRSGIGLTRALELARQAHGEPAHPRVFAAAQDIAYAATRKLALLDALTAQLAARPPAAPVAALLAVALAQLIEARHAAYTVVDQSVRAARSDRATAGAAGFVNATLRNFLRGADSLLERALRDEVARYNAPRWWIDKLRASYPGQWQSLLATQSEPPPLVLRVNPRRGSIADYLRRLQREATAGAQVGPLAVRLAQPRPVGEIPGFVQGVVSVQDAGAQLAASLLAPRADHRVLDACAAPGGKTGHLAELSQCAIDAVEVDPARAERVRSNLARLGFAQDPRIRVLVGDANDPSPWARGPYDRILLDAPCTASGIVRRHPDIPWLRRPADVAQLATIQARMLDALWPLVAPGGRLLYVVCSLFAEEGSEQVTRFLQHRGDARAVALPGLRAGAVQLLPTPLAAAGTWSEGSATPGLHDGFFYALLEKR